MTTLVYGLDGVDVMVVGMILVALLFNLWFAGRRIR